MTSKQMLQLYFFHSKYEIYIRSSLKPACEVTVRYSDAIKLLTKKDSAN